MLLGLEAGPLALATAAVALGGVVRGTAGFGGALVISPLLSMVLGPAQAVASTILIELAGFAQLLPASRPHIRWRTVLPMGLVAMLLAPVGLYFVAATDPGLMRRVIGGIVVGLTLLLMLGWRLKQRPGLPLSIGTAALSGFLEGVAGTPVPPVVLLLFAGPDSAQENRHNLIGYFVLLDTAALAMAALQGIAGPETLLRGIVFIPISFASTWLGARMAQRLPERILYRTALALILLIGLTSLLL